MTSADNFGETYEASYGGEERHVERDPQELMVGAVMDPARALFDYEPEEREAAIVAFYDLVKSTRHPSVWSSGDYDCREILSTLMSPLEDLRS